MFLDFYQMREQPFGVMPLDVVRIGHGRVELSNLFDEFPLSCPGIRRVVAQ
jgi:hypothetical protein